MSVIMMWCLCFLVCESQSMTKRPWVVDSALDVLERILLQNREHPSWIHDKVQDTPGQKILREGAYDFIVVGGGTTGSVVANRLSENPQWKVLLLEAGQDEILLNDIPVLSSFLSLTDYDWGYKTEPQSGACLAMKDHRCVWPSGKSLGGSSSINHMIFSRGNRLDFDEWDRLGNKGWSYEEVLPYMKKYEDMLIPALKNSRYHSTGGYLPVEMSYHSPQVDAIIAAAVELGFNTTADYNGEDQIGFGYHQVMMKQGLRYSASKAFLRPIHRRKNLHISLNSHVTKILIDPHTKQTLGVEFSKDRLLYSINVTREVILSAGALRSPQILMLSGIGPSQHLSELGIDVIQDLKVGHNLQDHVGFMGLTFVVDDAVQVYSASSEPIRSLHHFMVNASGPLSLASAVEGIAFLKTKYAQDNMPDIEFLIVSEGLASDNGGPLVMNGIGITPEFYRQVYKSIENKNVWSIIPIVVHPRSRGRIQLKDKNPFHHPLFDPKYFSDPHDVKVLVEGIKIALRVANTTVVRRSLGMRLHDAPVPACAALVFGSDEYWECAVRYLTTACYHQVSTCKMGPPTDEEAVVDPQLRVYGVRGLRVADASVIPMEVAGHLTATVYMIGEKVSSLIKDTYKF